MKILILGGTIFVGRHLVEAALKRGHEITLFNRGQHNSDLFTEVEKLRGDRDGNLNALEGRYWDVVIDTCGYVPRLVSDSATLLSDACEHYTFISSISVYANNAIVDMDEESPVGTLEHDSIEEVTGETYGPLKALCEQAAESAMPNRVLTVRPGLIVGPYDPTDRFTYWPVRMAQGGNVLAPGNPTQQIQFIDVRDLASWTLQMIEKRATGIYNTTGPNYLITMNDVFEQLKPVSQREATLIWLNEAFLLSEEVQPFTELPLWVPKEHAGMLAVNINKALKAGLTFRPLAETIRDTLEWHTSRPQDTELRAGLKREREIELLEKWHSLKGGALKHSLQAP